MPDRRAGRDELGSDGQLERENRTEPAPGAFRGKCAAVRFGEAPRETESNAEPAMRLVGARFDLHEQVEYPW